MINFTDQLVGFHSKIEALGGAKLDIVLRKENENEVRTRMIEAEGAKWEE